VNFGKLFKEVKAQIKKLKLHPRHGLNCYIHIDSQICTCGQEEIEEELAREQAEIETPEDRTDDALEPDLRTAYLEAIEKDN